MTTENKIIIALMVLGSLIGLFLGAVLENKPIACVDYIIDGDTVELQNGNRVRIAGIDTPEMNFYNEKEPEEGARKAKKHAEILLKGECLPIIYQESEVTNEKRGTYNRLIADFYLPTKEMLFSEYMLKSELAEPF